MLLFGRAWGSYLRVLQKWPTRTQMVQGTVIMGSGDIAAQLMVARKEEKGLRLDWKRTGRFAAVGGLFVAPTMRVWFGVLETLVARLPLPGASGVGAGVGAALAKVTVEQLTFAPVMHAAVISVVGAAQGLKVQQIKVKVKKDWPDVMLTNWMFWPWIQLGNFFFVPLLLRPLIVGIGGFFWNVYFAWKTNTARRY